MEQQISHFDTDDAPYTIGLVLDHSGSMAMVIDDVFKAALHTLQASKPVDEAFVIVCKNKFFPVGTVQAPFHNLQPTHRTDARSRHFLTPQPMPKTKLPVITPP